MKKKMLHEYTLKELLMEENRKNWYTLNDCDKSIFSSKIFKKPFDWFEDVVNCHEFRDLPFASEMIVIENETDEKLKELSEKYPLLQSLQDGDLASLASGKETKEDVVGAADKAQRIGKMPDRYYKTGKALKDQKFSDDALQDPQLEKARKEGRFEDVAKVVTFYLTARGLNLGRASKSLRLFTTIFQDHPMASFVVAMIGLPALGAWVGATATIAGTAAIPLYLMSQFQKRDADYIDQYIDIVKGPDGRKTNFDKHQLEFMNTLFENWYVKELLKRDNFEVPSVTLEQLMKKFGYEQK